MKTRHRLRIRTGFLRVRIFSAALLLCATAAADEDTAASGPVEAAAPAPPPPSASAAPPSTNGSSSTFPRVGGHLGFAVPIVTIADPVTVIGEDFVTVGLTPGLTVKLSEKWAVDFEFIALNELKNTPAATRYVVDPGVVYNAGPVSAGLRIASVIGAPTNVGLVPIVVLPVAKIADTVTYYVEGDVPLFLRDSGRQMQPSVGFQFQSGFAF
jgi:hypothetical protein